MDTTPPQNTSTGVIFAASPADYTIDSIAGSLTPVSSLPPSHEVAMLYPPLNQCGSSCVAYSSACSADSKYTTKHPNTTVKFSPRFIYQHRTTPQGMSLPEAYEIMKSIGCAAEDVCPVDTRGVDDQCDADRSCRKADAEAAAAPYRINSYWMIFATGDPVSDGSKVDLMKQAIHDLGAINIITRVYSSNSPTIWKPPASKTPVSSNGNHAVLLVGYDDGKRAFKLRNSWGVDWPTRGAGGHIDFPYDDVKYLLEARVFTFGDEIAPPTPVHHPVVLPNPNPGPTTLTVSGEQLRRIIIGAIVLVLIIVLLAFLM